jgi:hypothetical protein
LPQQLSSSAQPEAPEYLGVNYGSLPQTFRQLCQKHAGRSFAVVAGMPAQTCCAAE